jgi:hypothetical protein
MKACFLVLELICKKMAVQTVQSLRSVPVVQTVRCANYDDSNLVGSSRILGKNFPLDLRIPLTVSTKEAISLPKVRYFRKAAQAK